MKNDEFTPFLENLRINSCGVAHCTADWRWDTQEAPFHDYDIWFVAEGRGGLLTPVGDWPVRAGDCCFLRPGQRYVGRQNPDALLTVLHVHFDFIGKDGAPWFLPPSSGPRLWRSVEDFPFFRELLARTSLFFGRDDEATAALWLRAALLELWEQDRAQAADPTKGQWKSLLGPLCAQIQEYPERNWSLGQTAQSCGYSGDYFGRVFRRFTGLSFTSYVIRARINKAKLLLQSSNCTVQQIAEQLGYSDVSFFDRQFRQWVNTSPRQHRK